MTEAQLPDQVLENQRLEELRRRRSEMREAMEGWISSWSIGFLSACAKVSRRTWTFTTRLRGLPQVRSVLPRSKQEARRRNSRTSPAATGTTELAHPSPAQIAESDPPRRQSAPSRLWPVRAEQFSQRYWEPTALGL